MNGGYKELVKRWRNWWATRFPEMSAVELDRRARMGALTHRGTPQPTPTPSFRDEQWFKDMPPELQAGYGPQASGRPPGMASPPPFVPPPSYRRKKREEAIPPEERGKYAPAPEDWTVPGKKGSRFQYEPELQEAIEQVERDFGRELAQGGALPLIALYSPATYERLLRTKTEGGKWLERIKEYLQKPGEVGGGGGGAAGWEEMWRRVLPGASDEEIQRRVYLSASRATLAGGRPPGLASPPPGVPPPSYRRKKREEGMTPEERQRYAPPPVSDEEFAREVEQGVAGLMSGGGIKAPTPLPPPASESLGWTKTLARRLFPLPEEVPLTKIQRKLWEIGRVVPITDPFEEVLEGMPSWLQKFLRRYPSFPKRAEELGEYVAAATSVIRPRPQPSTSLPDWRRWAEWAKEYLRRAEEPSGGGGGAG